MSALVSLESLVPPRHPLRAVKPLVDEPLAELSPVYDEMCADTGRPSVSPERLLKATVLMALYSVRSERRPRPGGTALHLEPSRIPGVASTGHGVTSANSG